MIENEGQLQYSIQSLAKMYDLCERIAAQTIGDPETREDEIESIESMIRKIEQEVAEYLRRNTPWWRSPPKPLPETEARGEGVRTWTHRKNMNCC